MRSRLATLVTGSLAAVFLAGAQGVAAQTVADISDSPPRQPTKWVVDIVHSQVDFGVRHLVGRVHGTFSKWYALVSTEAGGWKLGIVNVTVETASLNTGNAYRDADLRSDRFFAVNRYPKMTFQGSGFAATDSTVDLNGLLTIRGRSKPVVLTGRFRGVAKDADGHERIAFQASGMVDRRDFGISWNENIAGTDLIGNDVEITIGIEAVRVD